jgi:hypothetical protein
VSRRWLWVPALLAVVVVGAYIGAVRRTTGPPLDPTSTAPDGTRALIELVARLGGTIDVIDGAPSADVDAALVLADRLPREQAEALLAWARDGGTLVVADPGSLLSPPIGGGVIDTVTGSCPFPSLEPVERLAVGVSRTYQPPPTATACFRSRLGQPFVVVADEGAGTVVSVGGPDLFTNDLLDEADNAVFVAALLAGEGRRVAFVRPAIAGTGERDLVDLVDTPVRAALAQLLVAFVVVALWRSRRLGRPVEEPQPVRIEGSELTRAVGRLLERNRRPERAAAILRDRARRELSAPLGIPLDAPVDVVVAALTARTGLHERDVHRAVAGPVGSDQDLVEVATLLARIREEITRERREPVPT